MSKTHPEAFEKISAALEAQSPVDIDGIPFAIWLIDIRELMPPGGLSVRVIVGAQNQEQQHTGELVIGRERLDELDIPEVAVETMRKIVRGELPPGTRELL